MKIHKTASGDRALPNEKNEWIPALPHRDDELYMRLALSDAQQAAAIGEVPVGAVIVEWRQNREPLVIARAYNQRETLKDPTAHAEILCLRTAGAKLGNWQLLDCTMYVTLEPCTMCAGALTNARIKRIVFGCLDPKAGATGSLYNIPADERLNHRPELTGGVLADEASHLLKAFFRARRKSTVRK